MKSTSTSIGETTRPKGNTNLVFCYGVRVQQTDTGSWEHARNSEEREIRFFDFDSAHTLAEELVRDGKAQTAEVFSQRMYVPTGTGDTKGA